MVDFTEERKLLEMCESAEIVIKPIKNVNVYGEEITPPKKIRTDIDKMTLSEINDDIEFFQKVMPVGTKTEINRLRKEINEYIKQLSKRARNLRTKYPKS